MQDPLSFRDAPYLLAEIDRSYDESLHLIDIQLNSSDDNPGVAIGVKPKSDLWQAKRSYLTPANGEGGAVLPSANFEPLPWVLSFQETGVALAQNSLASAQRIVKMNDPRFTAPEPLSSAPTIRMHAFGAMEKPPMMLGCAKQGVGNAGVA